jgi:predicted metal-dependent hydrolase
MNNLKVVEVEDIGQVILEHSTRARRLTLSVNYEGRIRAAVPLHVSFDSAMDFVRLKKKWVKKILNKIQQIKSRQRELTAFSSNLDRIQAKEVLTARLTELAKKHSFTFDRVYIRNQKSRWGSCSHKGDISLNMKIMVLAEELRDYVLLHELVHTKVYNHSARFWAELNKYVPDAKLKAAQLRQYDLRLL